MNDRLRLLKPTLDAFGQPFSVLDMGGGIQPQLAVDIAEAYPQSIVFLIEQDKVQLELPQNVVWLQKSMSVEDLVRLQECELFDVVLGFNVLHWFPVSKAWKALYALWRMGDHVFIQVPADVEEELKFCPNPDTVQYIHGRMKAQQIKPIGETVQFPRHRARPIYELYHIGNILTRTHWDAHDNSSQMVVQGRTAIKKNKSMVPWTPGMNLYNCLKLGIKHPRSELVRMLLDLELPSEGHGDVALHNMILTAGGLVLIDRAAQGFEDDDVNRQKAIEQLKGMMEC